MLKIKGKVLRSWITGPLGGKLLRGKDDLLTLKEYIEFWEEWNLPPELDHTIHYYEIPGGRLIIWDLSESVKSMWYMYCINKKGKVVSFDVEYTSGFWRVGEELYEE